MANDLKTQEQSRLLDAKTLSSSDNPKPSSSSAQNLGGGVVSQVFGFLFFSKGVDAIRAGRIGSSAFIDNDAYVDFLSQTVNLLGVKKGALIGAADITVAVILTVLAIYCFRLGKGDSTSPAENKSTEGVVLNKNYAHLFKDFDVRNVIVLDANNAGTILQDGLKQQKESQGVSAGHAAVNVFNLEKKSNNSYIDLHAAILFKRVLKNTPTAVNILVEAFMNHARLNPTPGTDFRDVVRRGLEPFREDLIRILGKGNEQQYAQWMDAYTNSSEELKPYDWNQQSNSSSRTP